MDKNPGETPPGRPDEALYLSRPSDLAALREAFDQAAGGNAVTLHLHAPAGGGKRALVGDLCRRLSAGEDDVLFWRTVMVDEEDGLRAVLRLYASLYAPLHRDPMLKGKVEMMLGAQIPQHPRRVQQWYQAFIDGLKRGAPKPGQETFQVSLPRDNPLLGLVELVAGISRKIPVIADFQNIHACQSLAIHALVEALLDRCREHRLLLVLGTEPIDERSRHFFPMPLLDMIERRAAEIRDFPLAPWGAEEAAAYLASKSIDGDAAAIAQVAGGRPGFVAELADVLEEQERLEDPLDGLSLATMFPREVDEDELEPAPEAGDDERRHATAADLDEVAWRAALLGRSFPSGLLADIGGFERDSVDDLLDAAGGLFSELEFSKPLQTWLYQFTHAIWREGVRQAWLDSPDRQEEARRIGIQTAGFLERFLVPRGYDFIPKTARLYAEMGEERRAMLLRSMALTSDRPEMWGMTHDLLAWFEQVPWPDPMRRTIYMNLMDRMARFGDVNQAEKLFNEAVGWAQEKQDRPLEAWLLFAGSRLDLRRQDHYRARDRASDALTIYQATEDTPKQAEVQNHLAMVELADGNPTAALERVESALRLGTIETDKGKRVLPQIAAHAEYIRGLVTRRERKFADAARHFRSANEIAGNTQQAPLALEAGLNFGQCLLLSGQSSQAADVLERVLNMARGLRDPGRERMAASLLSQAHGALKHNQAALKWAQHTLELTRRLKFTRFEPVDLYNVGFFQLLLDRPNEALALFRQARQGANLQQDVVFAKELLFHLGTAAARIGEQDEAREALTAAIPAAREARDNRKLAAAMEQLADLAAARGATDEAREHLQAAMEAAEQGQLKELRRSLRKKLASIGS